MPEQSVKQFRPDIIDKVNKGFMEEGVIFDPDDYWPEVMAYIERLEDALDHIATRALQNYTLGIHHMDEIKPYYESDGWKACWQFLGGVGETFLEALEDNMKGGDNA